MFTLHQNIKSDSLFKTWIYMLNVIVTLSQIQMLEIDTKKNSSNKIKLLSLKTCFCKINVVIIVAK